MAHSKNILGHVIVALNGISPSQSRRPTRQLAPALDSLEDRMVLSHFGGVHHQAPGLASSLTALRSTPSETSTSTGSTGTTSTAGLARQALQSDIQAIELNSGTTIGQLTAIHTAFQTLASDGLTPTSSSALATFEDSLVKSFANNTTLTGNATLLSQFEALYTSSPTAQQTTDLTTAYNALATAVSSSNITLANIQTIDSAWAAVLAAESSTSSATFPYFSLVTGRAGQGRGGCH